MSSELCRSSNTDVSPSPLEANRLELEAAEALAVLARTSTFDDAGGEGCSGEWGSKGKRAKKRVRNESPDTPTDPTGDPTLDSVNGGSDPPTLGEEDGKHPDEFQIFLPESNKDGIRPVFDKPNPKRQTRNNSFGSIKPRQTLTENEKEARKLRRILANRESARQTIRRRQALCDELAKRASDLQWENGNLKKEKEVALKEFQSLEVVNKSLKAQMANFLNVEIVESNNLKLIYDENYDAAHLRLANAFPTRRPDDLFPSRNESRPPFYLDQCPWYIPVRNGIHEQSRFLFNQSEEKCSASETCSRRFCMVEDLNEAPLNCSPDEDGDDYLLTSLALGPATVAVREEFVNENLQQLADATKAANARRKRKEMTRLKNLHGRHCKIN